TGRTTWSTSVGAVESLALAAGRPLIAGPTQIVLGGADGPVVLDYSNGKVTPAAADATFWCTTHKKYEYSLGIRGSDGQTRFTRRGGALAAICDANGQPATALPSSAATAATGARVGHYAVIATTDGYVGFNL